MYNDDYEELTENQHQLLEQYVTHTRGHVFVLKNLPEVIKGALFSRYSRSPLGLRTLLLKEFVNNSDESQFSSIAGEKSPFDQAAGIQKAQNFYDRILDGYGDDSIGELGGAHTAIENISMLGAKVLEDSRIGGSPLEKSTRYIYFDQKMKGEYLFYREPILMTSAYRDLYVQTCNRLFETYSALIPPLTEIIEKKHPRDPNVPQGAYNTSLRAKVLDCLRGLLPAGTLTNMGVYGNGRFFEQLLHKLHIHPLSEMQDIGKRMHEELGKVIPSFIRRSQPTHHTHQSYAKFMEAMQSEIKLAAALQTDGKRNVSQETVKLLNYDPEGPIKVAAGLLFAQTSYGLDQLTQMCKGLSEEELGRILEAGAYGRESRRHRSPRALEMASFTFEIVADFGVYRDLHRHRMLTQERQQLGCDLGYWIPPEILGTGLEISYRHAMDAGKAAHDKIALELPEEAQYVVPMAYNVRWYFHLNLRAIQWLTELRSSQAGHPSYRYVAQAMAAEVVRVFPEFKRFLGFVDYSGHTLGRLGQEIRKEEKLAAR